jgi:uracil-DNA glycosylase
MSVSVAHGRPSDKIESLRREAAACQACPLWKDATQTVFGEGPADAEIMFVGEQPGDREDREGRPFVGPAGQLLERALGRLCSRRLPRGSNSKCLTALVT